MAHPKYPETELLPPSVEMVMQEPGDARELRSSHEEETSETLARRACFHDAGGGSWRAMERELRVPSVTKYRGVEYTCVGRSFVGGGMGVPSLS